MRKTSSKTRRVSKAKTLRMQLSKAEREAALKACKVYRCSVPGYLQSRREELLVLDALIRKLS